MKKVMLILMLLAVCAGCSAADKPETKTEIKVGQVWKWGDYDLTKKVLEVGEKYIVWYYITDNGEITPKVETHDGFKREWELVEQVAVSDEATAIWYIITDSLVIKDPPQAKKTFKQIGAEIKTVEKANRKRVRLIENQKNAFIRESTFTGSELLKMRNAIKQDRDYTEPWLDYVLELILQERDNSTGVKENE